MRTTVTAANRWRRARTSGRKARRGAAAVEFAIVAPIFLFSIIMPMIEFGREFLITLAAVVLVTVLLLPLRVAAIAAVAIPITVAITVGILNAVGIELHQVTFAGLDWRTA